MGSIRNIDSAEGEMPWPKGKKGEDHLGSISFQGGLEKI